MWLNSNLLAWSEKNKVKSLVTQSCLALCNPMDCSPPGTSLHGILQARILDWIAIPFSRASSQSRDGTQVSYTAGRFFTIRALGKHSNHTRGWTQKSSSVLPTKGWYLPSTAAAAAAKSLQSCLTVCNPVDCSPPGSSIHGIFQARVPEWVALAFSGHLLLQRIKSQLLWPLTFTTHFKEFRMEIRNEVLCVFWEKWADHVFRWLDVFRRFYKPNSWISTYGEKH